MESIKAFSHNLINPYTPTPKGNRMADLEAEVARLKARCSELEQQLGTRDDNAQP